MNPKLVQFKTGEGGGAHIQKQNVFSTISAIKINKMNKNSPAKWE